MKYLTEHSVGHFLSADGTTADYSPLQGWSNNKRYAFFAFYPHDLELVNLDGDTPYSPGVPTVRYEMDPADLKGSMVDVMTAAPMTDLYWKSASDYNIPDSDNSADGEVNFAFQHRLSCLGLKITNASAGDITLTSVKFDLSGIKYHQTMIPLDGTSMSKKAATSETANLSIDKFSDEVWTISTENWIELNEKLIFIPQEEQASFKVTVEYKREDVDGYEGYSSSFTTNVLTSEFLEGKKHIVGIKFTDSGVQVTAPKAGTWVEIPPVNSSFK